MEQLQACYAVLDNGKYFSINSQKLCFIKLSDILLADPGKVMGRSPNTVVIIYFGESG